MALLEQLAPLLAAIQNDRLVILCGAGLSRSEPSKVPAARELATVCARRFSQSTGLAAPEGAEVNLEALAAYFYGDNDYWRLFLEKLIDWGPFLWHPNSGHLAIADLLCCGALRFALTTNLDVLIEEAAKELGEHDFRASLDGEAMRRPHKHRSMLKLHGCARIDRDATLWCKTQFDNNNGQQRVRERLETATNWLRENLRDSHLLVVGFWSDWPHLNDALSRAIEGNLPASITLVDILDDRELREKAPGLWEIAERLGPSFRRIPESGAAFLNELRRQFSIRFFECVLAAAAETYRAMNGVIPPAERRDALPDELSADELYDLRRDISGVAPMDVVREGQPRDHMRGAAATHLLVQERGGRFSGPRYVVADQVIVRIVNGASDSFHRVRARFARNQPASPLGEVVICVGTADDGGAPSDIVRESSGEPASIVRGTGQTEWLSFNQARERGLC